MASRKQTDEDAVDDIVLSDDYLGDFLANLVELRGRELKGGIGSHSLILDVCSRIRSRTFPHVGQVDNLRPIVNRPAGGCKQVSERFRTGRLVAALLLCGAG